jgi:transposase
MTVSSETCAAGFILSGGEVGDAPEGRLLLDTIGRISGPCGDPVFLLTNRAYEDWAARRLAFQRGYTPAVPPKKNRKHPWEYDKELYKRRNEVERMFRRLKAFRRISTCYDKLDLMFSSFIYLALCIIIGSSLGSLCVNTP